MAGTVRIGILSDIHYASAAEQAREDNFEYRDLRNPLLRNLLRFHRRYIWLHQPLRQNHRLDRFLEQGPFDFVVANGDYSCDTGFVGPSDDAACQSVRECLDKLRAQYGARLRVNFGDHELGKFSFVGRRGGMRLASWHRARTELGIEPFWQVPFGRYLLMGLVSSLVALPVFEADMLPAERPEWERLRLLHLEEVRAAFAALEPGRRVLLFCHDPSALPFLRQVPEVQARLGQIEQTIIGHLHSNLILRQSRLLSGMPRIEFLGHSIRRFSTALRQARQWREFNVRLCPALAGIELLKDGGYLTVDLDPEGRQPAKFNLHRLRTGPS